MTVLSFEDPFIWMENLNDRAVLEFVAMENKRLRDFLGNLPSKLYKRIQEYYDLKQVLGIQPTKIGYFMLEMDKESRNITLLRRDGSRETIVSSLDLGKDYFLQYFTVRKEGDVIAYSYSYGGADIGKMRFINVETGEIIDELEGSIWSIVWLSKDKYYYVRFYREGKTPDGVSSPATRVFIRENGSDEMVFGEGLKPAYFISLTKSNFSDKALILVSYGWRESKVYGGNINDPESWRLIHESNVPAHPIEYVNNYYLIAVYDKEGYGRIITKNNKVHAIDFVPEWNYPLQGAVITNRYVIAHYLVNASSILRLFNLNGELIRELKFNPPGSIRSLVSNGEETVFKYESFWIPYRLYSLMDDLKIIDKLELEKDYIVNEGFVESKDGTKIHYFEVKKRDTIKKKALIYGYGGFRISITPSFSPMIIPLIDDGGTYIITNLRGGLEYGEKWHISGMRENKQNVFDDFISVIENYRNKGYLTVAIGRSNGGLLVGATVTQRPKILNGAVIGYPVLDMLRFHKLYIGAAWIPEYGNPNNPEEREFLLEYSPYHNIRANQRYPLILVYTGLHDDRVHPAHAFKFVMKLREVKAPVYLRTETTSGHAGASPEVKIRESADILAFIYKALKMI